MSEEEQIWIDDSYDRWKDEQMQMKEEEDRIAEAKRIHDKYAFIDLPIKKFEEYIAEEFKELKWNPQYVYLKSVKIAIENLVA